jgi:hypothetical protein
VVRARWAVAVFVVEKLHENSARERERETKRKGDALRGGLLVVVRGGFPAAGLRTQGMKKGDESV